MAANEGIINIPTPMRASATMGRRSYTYVPNTPEAAEELAAAEAAIATRAFNTSRLPIYVPTGHGELLVRDGEFVKHRVPDGCVYITSGYTGVSTRHDKFVKLLESFKNPEIMNCFQNPTLPENQIKLKKFFEPHMFDETGKLIEKKEGIFSIKYPGEEYIEARYYLTSDFSHYEITDSGFYNAKLLAKKNIKKLEELPAGSGYDLKHILECYNGSIIPGPRFIYDRLHESYSGKKGTRSFLVMRARDATAGWPFLEQYEDFQSYEEWKADFDKKINDDISKRPKRSDKTIVDYFIRLLRAIREELRGLPENIYELKPKSQRKLIAPINEFLIKGLNMLKRAKAEIDRAGVTHYPFVFSTLELFERLRQTKYDAPNVSRLVRDIQNYIETTLHKRENSEEQFPGEPVLQSFLFKNFPGIHINFVCRVPSDKKRMPPSKILKAQRLSDENRAAKQDLMLARELAEPSVLIGPGQVKAAATERRLEMARLLELDRQAGLVSDPYALRDMVIYPPKRNVSEAELEEMREFARTHVKQLSDAPITPRSTNRRSLPSSFGSWETPRSSGTRSTRSGSTRRTHSRSNRSRATRRQRNRA